MKIEALKKKWKYVSDSETFSGYKSVRLSAECVSDLFIGVNESGLHCLILILPKDYKHEIRAIDREKISLSVFSKKHLLVITLLDSEYSSLFDDLILSLLHAISEMQDVESYCKNFIRIFYQWLSFFAPSHNERLSKEVVMGLWGEMFLLNKLIDDSNGIKINELLEGWVGPYNRSQDFIFVDKNIEVKTKHLANVTVSISSEHQLEADEGKQLVLSIVSVREDLTNGLSIKDVLLSIKRSVFEHLGDFGILLKTISQKGLSLQDINEYDNFRFYPIHIYDYDCLKEGFPKITTFNIIEGISKVKYNLNVNNISQYVTKVREF